MKKTNFRPLIMILPCILLLAVFMMMDHPLPEEESGEISASTEALNLLVQGDLEEEEDQDIDQKSQEIGEAEATTSIVEETTGEAGQGDVQETTTQTMETTTQAQQFVHKTWTIGQAEDTWKKARTIQIVIGNVGDMKNEKSGTPILDEPDPEAFQIDTLQFRSAVELTGKQDMKHWYRVKLYGNNTEGYVSKDAVIAMTLPVGGPTDLRREIIEDAFSYMGLKFVRYGKSLETGTDCSNFIQMIYEKHGVVLPKEPNTIAAAGFEISDEDARPGDIVYYDKANNRYGHVGIYIGNGMILNSSGHSGKTYPKGGVHMCTIVYPDREEYHMINVIDQNGK